MEDKTCQSLGPNGRGLLWFLLLPLLLLLLLMLLLLLFFFLRKTERSLPVKWHDEVVEPVPRHPHQLQAMLLHVRDGDVADLQHRVLLPVGPVQKQMVDIRL